MSQPDKLFRIVKLGKGLGFEMPDGSRISCECIGEPFSDAIVSAFEERSNKQSVSAEYGKAPWDTPEVRQELESSKTSNITNEDKEEYDNIPPLC